MSIFLNKDSKVIVQGITGGEGTKHTRLMMRSGTNVVGGVNARKAGTTVTHADKDGNDVELPVFGSVEEAMKETGADVSVAFVPPAFTKDACIEAIDAGHRPARGHHRGRARPGHRRGLRLPRGQVDPDDRAQLPRHHHAGRGPGRHHARHDRRLRPGRLVSKSGTLTYQMMFELRDFGFSTAIGIGGDPVIGTTHIDALEAFEADPDTKAIVMIGEIGGDAEERAAAYIKEHVTKPVVGYVAGFTAPEGKTMGHAGAIVSSGAGTAQGKKDALEAAGSRSARRRPRPPSSCGTSSRVSEP